MEKLVEWLNRLLIADLFLVFGFFFWFVAAVVADSFDLNLGLGLWQRLWQPVIQPVLGIMMLGAIASGLIGWVKNKFFKPEQNQGLS
ncbi:hypothetical protein Pse7367_1842 [Thalassoporum mexicanum PCC 7367]|uniref:hypothetical protein n=1 Tax=Thalassoporum mexicanum TaxID=3457544 RepID=UPI00029FC6BA|nr:hypothetical protein [Pseudanabaena sp. PCC 7367]AFY70118.1 hypothetical protein Pse7367_1842 [Pseudanabaena sp. PCC 7367]